MDRHAPLWRQCAFWLIETGVLPQQHKTTHKDCEVFDLAQTLRDGVVLSNLLNIIKPGAVDLNLINQRPQMLQFLCMHNVRTVISSLRNVFKIPQNDLFGVGDLYNMTNFRKVLKVLSILSHLEVSSKRFKPFPSDTGQKRSKTEDDDEMFQNLPDLASERELIDEENLYDSVAEDEKEGIYGTVIASIGARVPSTPTLKDKRSHCIDEIYQTERNYVDHLEMMLYKFIEPLKRTLTNEDIRVIFSNTDQLVPVHKEFLMAIEQERKSNALRLSQPFLKFKDRFLKYGEYCSNLQDALTYLSELWKSDKIRERIEDCQNKASRNKYKLRELLCVSMQRILKYHLLVKELHKHTNDSHHDRNDLGKALEAMQELSHYVNEVKRDSEMLATISKVEACMTGYTMNIPLSTYGRLLKDGDLKVRCTTHNKLKVRFTYLFNQALLVTSLKNEKYKLKDLLRLDEYELEDTAQVKAAKWSWNWTLREKRGSSCYTFHAKTEHDKMRWMENMKTAYDSIEPICLKDKKHSFKMASFNQPTYCFNCNKLLLGCLYQGYICQRTNMACHKWCLAQAWKVLENSMHGAYKAQRDYNGNPSPPFDNASVITFTAGEQIVVEEKTSLTWWMGRVRSQFSKRGYFPASYVSAAGGYRAPPTHSGLVNAKWYAGLADRTKAESLLAGKPSGTFLVRKRDEHLAISLVYQSEVKHIKIVHSNNLYCVAESQKFSTVPELVEYYQSNMMSSSFSGLDTTLRFPYHHLSFPLGGPSPTSVPVLPTHRRSLPGPVPTRPTVPVTRNQTFSFGPAESPSPGGNGLPEIIVSGRTYAVQGRARVLFDFEPSSPQELGLRANQMVNIISKAGNDRGWWKGEHGGRIGYFPSAFIEEVEK